MPDSVSKIYIAAPFSRGPELRPYRDKLADLGYVVTSRWLDAEASQIVKYPSGNRDADAIASASRDYQDLFFADTIISVTFPGEGRGGRHVEFGMALAWAKKLYIAGPREHIFHTLPAVTWYPDFESLLAAWES